MTPGATTETNTAAVLAGLKDFQRRTVDHVFDRLYAPGGSGRYLVADEVGLGKTLVARGVIARAIEHLRGKVERIDILYICSNSDIARQNIQRLKFDSSEHLAISSRLTLLPLQLGKLRGTKTGVNFISFTPATSFDLRDGLGLSYERVLLYWMLRRAWNFGEAAAPMNVLQGNAGVDRFRAEIRRFDPDAIDAGAQTAFGNVLARRIKEQKARGETDLRTQFEELCDSYAASNRKVAGQDAKDRSRWVGSLRSVLASSCIEPLEPDLVILDEFQRFSHLLEQEQDDASELARAVFGYPDVRVLMLSATPYKMYTVADETGGEDHYDFVRTVSFLENRPGQARTVEKELEKYRAALLGIIDGEGPESLRTARQSLEERLRRVMVRTERLASTPDRNGMLHEVPPAPSDFRAGDALNYVVMQNIARELRQPDTFEYWKSAPYALNFLDDSYQLKHQLREAIDNVSARPALARALSISETATLSWDDVQHYRAVDPGNPKMRALTRDLLDQGAHLMLWLPPCLPHYRLAGPFAEPGARTLTKRLIFSSWRVVPRAIAAMLSYEVERRLSKGVRTEKKTPEHWKDRRGRLQFGVSGLNGRLADMPVLALLYPSLYLAEACDPARLAARISEDRALAGSSRVAEASIDEVLAAARDIITLSVERHLPPSPEDGVVDQRWYWVAPLLLNRTLREGATLAWFRQADLASAWMLQTPDQEEKEDEARVENQNWKAHVEAAQAVAKMGTEGLWTISGNDVLGRRPDDLVEVLAQLAVAGPAVAMFRSLLRVVGGESALAEPARISLRNAAGATAWAFRVLFNRPEGAAVLRATTRDKTLPYWRQVLGYCVDGGLQAVLDEYIHGLRDHLGLLAGSVADRAGEIAAEIADALGLRTTDVRLDDLVVSEAGRTVHREVGRLRTHFAVRFGDQQSDEGKVTSRADQVRKAFNSPFWPFVVATTSVGQEGLDFHSYCHAVVHWNLPSNPVDFEQREGRVHRYKGHAVRKNVAQLHGDHALLSGERDYWEKSFEQARTQRPAEASDIVPYWVYTGGDARIERHVFSLPLSRDQERVSRLRSTLAIYRMVFGQPRQDDLISYLLERVPKEALPQWLEELRIELGPVDASSDLHPSFGPGIT